MNGCLFFRSLLFGMVILPYMSYSQPLTGQPAAYHFGGDETLTSNVPLNEINIHAFRHFRKRYPAVTGETWLKTEGGYTVSFKVGDQRNQVRFDARGGFQYALKYYAGKDISSELSGLISRKFHGYDIDVVTEITNGEKTFYLVKIENRSSVKTLSVSEGKVEIFEELINGGVRSDAMRSDPGK